MTGSEGWQDWFDDGEALLWQGAPQPGVIHWGRNILLTAFGIPFLSAGLVCAAMGLGYIAKFTFGEMALGVFLAAFSVPFVAVGGAMIFGTWVSDYIVPRRTRYALTSKAGYVATRYWGRKMDVFPVRAGTRVELQQHRSGAATVHFHFEETRDSDGDVRIEKKGFENIADGQAVYRLIRDVQAAQEVDARE
ncbi:MAG: hypothetical protein HKN27_00055 [Silicimonas sp.]|nr:hypothetical protein [Silicimonas sp.]